MTAPAKSETPAEREIVIRRTLNAPREAVFRAWTDPDQVVRWWGPNGFVTLTSEMDVRPGGVWRFVMQGPDGIDYPNRIVYREVAPPERLTYSQSDDAPAGAIEDAFESTVNFEDRRGATELTLRMLFPTTAARETAVRQYGAIEGGRETLARLAEHLSGRGGS